ncbi:TPA: hypothetical protein IAA87_01605 [Candidatus Avigastranaerophilus faecigallinarum]|nr:hypothetical protein [Candidatus Avigastranaerophilus faecigallinarum]
MKRIIILLMLFLLSVQYGICSLVNNDINIFNLKSGSMYLLDIDSSVKNINVSNKDIVNLTPITSVGNEKKQLFIETNKDGVCDVILTTNIAAYQIRFISGPKFQDNKVGLTEIDLPIEYERASK